MKFLERPRKVWKYQVPGTPRKTNMSPLKDTISIWKYIFQPSFFRGYVSFQGSNSVAVTFKNPRLLEVTLNNLCKRVTHSHPSKVATASITWYYCWWKISNFPVDMENLPLFTGFSTSQVVRRISSIYSRGVFFFQGEYETYVAKNHWIFYCLFGALGFPCSSIWLSHLAPREATLQENEESVFSQGIFFFGGWQGVVGKVVGNLFLVFFFLWSSFFVATYNCFGFASFLG